MSCVEKKFDYTAYNEYSLSIEVQEKEVQKLYNRLDLIDQIMRRSAAEIAFLGIGLETLREQDTSTMKERVKGEVLSLLKGKFEKERISQLEGVATLIKQSSQSILQESTSLTAKLMEQEEATKACLEEVMNRQLEYFTSLISDSSIREKVGQQIGEKMGGYLETFSGKARLINQIEERKQEIDRLRSDRRLLRQSQNGIEHFCITGNVSEVRAAIEANIFPWTKKKYVCSTVNGVPLIILATQSNQPDVINCLLEYGADPCARDFEGYQAIHYAAKKGNQDIVTMLLSRDASVVHSTGLYGRTALHMASYNGNAPLIPLLVKYGANVNACTNDEDQQKTPLHDAAMQNRLHVVAELVKVPSLNVTIRDKGGFTSLYHAVLGGHIDLIGLIVGHPSFSIPALLEDINHPRSLAQIKIKQYQQEIQNLLQNLY